ncbi:MAG TPA: hypothetical protein VG713_16275 [Pirellulales bacterium]|nr:hypothetical protein [Pirellulales bacterium]
MNVEADDIAEQLGVKHRPLIRSVLRGVLRQILEGDERTIAKLQPILRDRDALAGLTVRVAECCKAEIGPKVVSFVEFCRLCGEWVWNHRAELIRLVEEILPLVI